MVYTQNQWANKQTSDLFDILENHQFLDYLYTVGCISTFEIRGAIYEISEEITDPQEKNKYFMSIKNADHCQLVAYYRIKIGFPVWDYERIFQKSF